MNLSVVTCPAVLSAAPAPLWGMVVPRPSLWDGYAVDAMVGPGEHDAAAARDADLLLARAAADGDHGAQSQLITRLLPHLRSVARAILGNPADVDDAVQVALMRVLKGLSGYAGRSTLVRWSRRIAAHACLRLKQDNQRRLRAVELAPDPALVPLASATSQPQDNDEVERYLQRLPDVQREALVLRHVLGHSVAEVAELVGAPLDTVKSRLLYARRAMREMIQRDAASQLRKQGAQG